MEKMTYVVALNSAIDCGALSPEVVAKLTALREQMEKKSNAIHKPTAKQTANVDYRFDIFDTMESGKAYTVTELMGVVPSVARDGLSNQRVSALVRQLIGMNMVTRSMVKGTAYFSKVE